MASYKNVCRDGAAKQFSCASNIVGPEAVMRRSCRNQCSGDEIRRMVKSGEASAVSELCGAASSVVSIRHEACTLHRRVDRECGRRALHNYQENSSCLMVVRERKN